MDENFCIIFLIAFPNQIVFALKTPQGWSILMNDANSGKFHDLPDELSADVQRIWDELDNLAVSGRNGVIVTWGRIKSSKHEVR